MGESKKIPKSRVAVGYGYCHCGCDNKTKISKRTRTKWGHVKGRPIPYLMGYHSKINGRPVIIPTPARPDIPRGECYCGCGEQIEIATKNDPLRGLIAGKPCYYVRFHHRRSSPVEYVKKDMGYKTPCWIWERAIDKNTGYGCVTDDDREMRSAHVVYYQREHGPIPEGKHLDHLCRVKRCVRPDHLEPVTQQVNVQRGIRAKLDPEAVQRLRDLRVDGYLYRELSELFGIGTATAQNAAKGASWDNVAGPLAPLMRKPRSSP